MMFPAVERKPYRSFLYPIVHRKFTRPAPAGIDNNGQTVYN